MGDVAKAVLPVAASYFFGPQVGTALGVSAAAGSAIAGAGTALLTSSFGSTPALQETALSPATPEVTPPPVITPPTAPTADVAQQTAARTKKMAAQLTSTGRAATVLTNPAQGEKLG